MSTFSKLSLVAQYDDMCRLVNKIICDSFAEEEASITWAESVQKRIQRRDSAHEKEKENLRSEINDKDKEIRKLNRQLSEARAALVREAEEKKRVARERKALHDQIRQVRQLVESTDGYENSDGHRRRLIKCLGENERLSPIQSFEDSDDCASGLDYDRTEEDIIDEDRPRRVTTFIGTLENNNEQPTLLYRYLDKGSEDDNQQQEDIRKDSRRSGATQRSSNPRSKQEVPMTPRAGRSRDVKYLDIATDTDSNGVETDNDIEYYREQLQKYEAEKREKMSSARSTPNVRHNNDNKAATLSARSTASLMKTASTVSNHVTNSLKPHTFVRKKIFKPKGNCGPCGELIKFWDFADKCENCGVVCHPQCKDKCPLPCVKITTPAARSRPKKIIISDYVNSDADPKVPALIVHCCNEIERGDNLTTEGLYRVAARTSEIEDLQQKILKSKTGMPNLSKVDVHLLTGVVKRFLQSLDESLITTTLWSHFAEAAEAVLAAKSDDLVSGLDGQNHMEYYIDKVLPAANRETLAYLMQHLHAIDKHSEKNMMTLKNLSKTLAPTIVGNSSRNPTTALIQKEHRLQAQIMDSLLSINKEFWINIVDRSASQVTASLGSRLLDNPSSSSGVKTRASSRLTGTLPTPKLKPLFS